MKGITGHRVHDAYASMALGRVGGARSEQQAPRDAARAPAEAVQVKISEGARQLAQGASVERSARVEELKEKVAQGPSAFDAQLVAQRLVADFSA